MILLCVCRLCCAASFGVFIYGARLAWSAGCCCCFVSLCAAARRFVFAAAASLVCCCFVLFCFRCV